MSKILINAEYDQALQVAVLKDKNSLVDYWAEYKQESRLDGAIFLAKINSDYLPNLQAFFVDLGLGSRQGFWSIDQNEYDIAALSQGSAVLLQVTNVPKEKSKGPKMSSTLRIQGRYCTIHYNQFEKESTANTSQDPLQIQLAEILPEKFRVSVRRNSHHRSSELIIAEATDLLASLQQCIALAPDTTAPALIRYDSDLLMRTFRSHMQRGNKFVVDHYPTFEVLQKQIKLETPDLASNLEFYDRTVHHQSLFAKNGINKLVEELHDKTVHLADGSNIVIESSEAMTTIDVNSAAHKQSKALSSAEQSKEVNLAAASEIPRQLKLRDIGGLVVVDFIDMESDEDRQAVEEAFAAACKSDTATLNFAPISRFGLMEIARQRIGRDIRQSDRIECEHCKGKGEMPTSNTILQAIYDEILTQGLTQLSKGAEQPEDSHIRTTVVVQAAPSVINFISRDMHDTIVDLMGSHNIFVHLYADAGMHYPQYNVNPGGNRLMKNSEASFNLFSPNQPAQPRKFSPHITSEVTTQREILSDKHETRQAQRNQNKQQKNAPKPKGFLASLAELLGIQSEPSSQKSSKSSPQSSNNRRGKNNQRRGKNSQNRTPKPANNAEGKPESKPDNRQHNKSDNPKPESKRENNNRQDGNRPAKPADRPADKQAGKPADKQADKHADKQANKPVNDTKANVQDKSTKTEVAPPKKSNLQVQTVGLGTRRPSPKPAVANTDKPANPAPTPPASDS